MLLSLLRHSGELLEGRAVQTGVAHEEEISPTHRVSTACMDSLRALRLTTPRLQLEVHKFNPKLGLASLADRLIGLWLPVVFATGE